MGDLDSVDEVCRMVANRAGCIVASGEYRLAPEHKFPGPVEDGYAVVAWVAEHAATFGADPTRLAVGGESAGGNIAAVASELARERGGPAIRFQVLIYPPLDFTAARAVGQELAERPTLTDERMQYFDRHYFRSPDDARSPLASPLLTRDLAGLPPALVITAEYDPLASEGAAYAERLRQAGVEATHTCYEGMIHGFYSMPGIVTASRTAIDEVSAALRAAFNPA